jgi:hypothetical protein
MNDNDESGRRQIVERGRSVVTAPCAMAAIPPEGIPLGRPLDP